MKTLSIAAALVLLAASGHGAPETPEAAAERSQAAFGRLDDMFQMIGGLVVELRKKPKPTPAPAPPAPPPVQNPFPLQHYLAAIWICQNQAQESPGFHAVWGVRHATVKCVKTAADWKNEAEKACAGKCRKTKDPKTGQIVVKCGINYFSVDTPCVPDNS